MASNVTTAAETNVIKAAQIGQLQHVLFEPFAAFSVCGNQSGNTENIDIAAFVVIYCAVHSPDDLGVFGNDIRYLDPGDIERLGRGAAGRRVPDNLIGKSPERGIIVPRIGDLAVNFVRDFKRGVF